MSESSGEGAEKFVSTLHMLSIDAASKVLVDQAMKGAEQGLFSAYFASNRSTLKGEDGKTVELNGCIVVLAGSIPKADIEALENYIGGMTQETLLTGKDVRKIVDLRQGEAPGDEPPTGDAAHD